MMSACTWAKPEYLAVIDFAAAGPAKKFYNSAVYAAPRAVGTNAAELYPLLLDGLPS